MYRPCDTCPSSEPPIVVARSSADDLPLKLRKQLQDIEGQSPHRCAGVELLPDPDEAAEYYANLALEYSRRRDTLLRMLERKGFRCFRPKGPYYIMADIRDLGFSDDVSLVRHPIEKVGVAAVPESSFFEDPRHGAKLIRFCFCKKYETLEKAGNRLQSI